MSHTIQIDLSVNSLLLLLSSGAENYNMVSSILGDIPCETLCYLDKLPELRVGDRYARLMLIGLAGNDTDYCKSHTSMISIVHAIKHLMNNPTESTFVNVVRVIQRVETEYKQTTTPELMVFYVKALAGLVQKCDRINQLINNNILSFIVNQFGSVGNNLDDIFIAHYIGDNLEMAKDLVEGKIPCNTSTFGYLHVDALEYVTTNIHRKYPTYLKFIDWLIIDPINYYRANSLSPMTQERISSVISRAKETGKLLSVYCNIHPNKLRELEIYGVQLLDNWYSEFSTEAVPILRTISAAIHLEDNHILSYAQSTMLNELSSRDGLYDMVAKFCKDVLEFDH